ncbi:sigma-54-dependent Fis family transcriptional regulator [Flavobacterium maritimum]|uniref:sigma-54-dependent Fis family transcriptional regulator n=1 Tax=Flavobacterium maritimum TaxID=3149042 RepID=UPI0032B46A91
MLKDKYLYDSEINLFLSISQATASIRNKIDLVDFIQEKLKNVFNFSDLAITRFNLERGTYKVFLEHCDKSNQHPDFNNIAFCEYPINDGLHNTIMDSESTVVLLISELIQNGMKHFVFLQEAGIREVAGIRLLHKGEVFGTMVLLSEKEGSFPESHRRLIKNISSHVSSAVSNVISNEEIEKKEREQSILLSLSNQMAMVKNKDELFEVINNRFKELFSLKSFGIILMNEDRKTHRAFLLGVSSRTQNSAGFKNIADKDYDINDGIFNKVLGSDSAVIFDIANLEEPLPLYAQFWKKKRIQKIIGIELRVAENELGCLFVQPTEDFEINPVLDLLKGVSSQVAIALSNIISNEKIASQLKEILNYKELLENEKSYLLEEVATGNKYSDIIGFGSEMQKVFHLLTQVAFTNSTVLILGETGTGKELIARAIHTSSPRKNNLMVKVNCAALPADLIESELFGHEKGSFTGAIERRIGKFELAHKGTLFLDEIGEMPQKLQMKLLRALQEREIERVGGKETIKVDVRIITATNRNLIKEVEEGKFRRDLYYRLNVFPIQLPPLKHRREDIPALVSHFISKFSKSIGKDVNGISKPAMAELKAYQWPGNVRELEHVIERSILMANECVIKNVFLPSNENFQGHEQIGNRTKTIDENEKQHIIDVLKSCNGKVFGSNGAAKILGIPHTTLYSKIKKLGITKSEIYQ